MGRQSSTLECIPNELVSYILISLFDRVVKESGSYENITPRLACVPLVCKRLASVFVGTPEIWTRIWVGGKPGELLEPDWSKPLPSWPATLERIRRHVERSRTLPLDIISTDAVSPEVRTKEVVRLLSPHIVRWRTLSIIREPGETPRIRAAEHREWPRSFIDKPLSNLVSLTLQPTWVYFPDNRLFTLCAPNLRSLTSYCFPITFAGPTSPALVHVGLTPARECHAIIQIVLDNRDTLETLEYSNPEEIVTTHVGPFKLSKVHTLLLGSRWDLLSLADLPLLRTLGLYGTDLPASSSFPVFPAVQELLWGEHSPKSRLASLRIALRSLPKLVTINFGQWVGRNAEPRPANPSPWDEAFKCLLVLESGNQAKYCPLLTTVVAEDVRLSIVVKLLEARPLITTVDIRGLYVGSEEVIRGREECPESMHARLEWAESRAKLLWRTGR